MEAVIILPSLVLIALSAICFYAISLWYKPRKTSIGTPPGAKGLPYVGETLDFVRCNQRGNPEGFILSRMRKFSTTEIFTTSLLGADNLAVLCGASGNKFFLMTANDYLTTWFPTTLMKLLLAPENKTPISKYAKNGRRLATEFFKPEFLKKEAVGLIDRMAKQHFEKHWAPEQQPVRGLELVKSYTSGLACRVILNMDDPEKVTTLMRLFKDIMAGMLSMPINFPGTAFYRALKSAQVARDELRSIVKQRKVDIMMTKNKISDDIKSSSSKDMLSYMLLSAYDLDGEFPSDIVMVDHCFGYLFSDNDNISSVITCTVKYLADLPHVYARVLDEQMEIVHNKKQGEVLNWGDIQKMKYTWNVACETMRLAPPNPGTIKEVIADFTYGGYTIPKGWKAYWTVHSTNKNPKYFKNPDEFDPTRFEENRTLPFSFIPFGGGYHVCPGREYVKIKILVFIHNLVTQYGFEQVLPNEKIIFTSVAIPANGLPMWIRRRCTMN